MNVFVINAGSSSLKFQVIATDLERIRQDKDELLCRGQVERVGGKPSSPCRAMMAATRS
jgi:acetate kinase